MPGCHIVSKSNLFIHEPVTCPTPAHRKISGRVKSRLQTLPPPLIKKQRRSDMSAIAPRRPPRAREAAYLQPGKNPNDSASGVINARRPFLSHQSELFSPAPRSLQPAAFDFTVGESKERAVQTRRSSGSAAADKEAEGLTLLRAPDTPVQPDLSFLV